MKPVTLKAVRGLGLALVLSILLVGFFAYFLPHPQTVSGWDKPVLQPHVPVYLEESSLVTFLKQIPLIYQYKKVKIEKNELYVDLMWPQTTLEGAYQEAAYADALRLIRFMFTGTPNVEKVYLRFIGLQKGMPALIVAVSCERSQSLLSQLTQPEGTFKEPKQILERYARLVYGTGWRN